MQNTENRNFFRLPVEIPVKITHLSADDFHKLKSVNGLIRDLSGGGMRLETTDDIDVNEQVTINFSLPLQESTTLRDFYLRGQILRKNQTQRKGFFEHGVEFVNILPGIQDKIVKYLFDLQISARYHIKYQGQ